VDEEDGFGFHIFLYSVFGRIITGIVTAPLYPCLLYKKRLQREQAKVGCRHFYIFPAVAQNGILHYKHGKDIIQPSFKTSAERFITAPHFRRTSYTMWSKPNENRCCC